VRNEVRLGGTIVAREALRHTPAGVPILAFTLKHQSMQVEGAVPRQVGFEIEAMAMGDVAQGMNALQVGQRVRLAGFLANRRRLSTRVVLHVNQLTFE
jgi:primosomal replication protein N